MTNYQGNIPNGNWYVADSNNGTRSTRLVEAAADLLRQLLLNYLPNNYSNDDDNSSAGLPTDNESSETKQTKRIRIACDTCRRKKIKCDGGQPCTNCQTSKNATCHYEERRVKRKKPKGSTKPKKEKLLDNLDSRLANLENVMMGLTNKLDSLVKSHDPAPEQTPMSEPSNQTICSNQDLYPPDHSNDDEDDHQAHNIQLTDGGNMQIGGKTEVYFGTHCIMCIFSDKSMDFIDEIMKDDTENVTQPIRNMPLVFLSKCKGFLMQWIDPPAIDFRKKRQLLTRPFPEDTKLVYELLDIYAADTLPLVSETTLLRELFDSYYNNNHVIDLAKRRRFKVSELLLMTSALLLAISTKIRQVVLLQSKRSSSNNTPASTDSQREYGVNELMQLKQVLIDNAVFFYHRISIISDGIETIMAIIHFMIFIETNFVTMQVSYILISVAVRHAQEIGLHRPETYEGLPIADQLRRWKIWWLCHYYDVESCFRTGNSPVVSETDISPNHEEEIKELCRKDHFLRTGLLPEPDTHHDMKLLLQGPSDCYVHIYMILLTRLRSKSYARLFSATAMAGTEDQLVASLDEINAEMDALAQNLPEVDRVCFYDDPNFELFDARYTEKPNSTMLSVHFVYLAHVMCVNRIPFLAGREVKARTKYGELSIRAARTILILLKHTTRENTSTIYSSWNIFYQVSAFLTIIAAIINHPQSSRTPYDLELLIRLLMEFFGPNFGEWFNNPVERDIEILMGLITNLMLKMVIRFYETRMNTRIIENNPNLQKHFEGARAAFPAIFSTDEDFKTRIKSMFGPTPSQMGQSKRKGPVFGNSGGVFMGTLPAPTRSNESNRKAGLSNILHPSNENSPLSATSDQVQTPRIDPSYRGGKSTMLTSPYKDSLKEDQVVTPDMPQPMGDFFSDLVNEDDISLMFYSQINSLPNFFSDNFT